jgi:hypothetical protein
MIDIISAIGSLGTFVMAIFYFISVSVQLYQMKISFLPTLGFNQILLEKDEQQNLNLKNTILNSNNHQDHLQLYNLGGGTAKNINIEILIGKNNVIQSKYIPMLPSKKGYMLSINKKVFDGLDKTIKHNGYKSDMYIKISYNHSVSRKKHQLFLNGYIDNFNTRENKDIYELQFINDI